MNRYFQIILLILLGLSYIEPHLKKIRLLLIRLILYCLSRVLRGVSRLWGVGVLAALGALSLVNMSGYATVIQSNEKTFYFLLIVGIIVAFKRLRPHMILNKKDFIHGFLLFCLFWLVSWASGYGDIGIRYMSYYLCIFIVSQMYINDEDMMYIHWIYCGLCTLILAVAFYGTTLDGWNENTLSIVAVQLLLVFMITHKPGIKKQDRIFIAIVIFEIILLSGLYSRGAQISAILALILLKRYEKIDRVLQKKGVIFLMVILPFVIAAVVVIISKMPFVEALNDWSIRQFNKPIFNERDEIWEASFSAMAENKLRLFIGSGHIASGYYHNSAVACLSAYGIIGYILYVMVFYKILCKGALYWNDDFVRKCMIMFYIICIEQSMENTLFQCGAIVATPYIILGLMLGRINRINGIISVSFDRWDIQGLWHRYESWKLRRAIEKELESEEEENRSGDRIGRK